MSEKLHLNIGGMVCVGCQEKMESGLHSAKGVLEASVSYPKGTADILYDESRISKVVFLNFWATWCPPCRAEMPDIQALYEETAADPDSELVILGSEGKGHPRRQGLFLCAYVPYQGAGSCGAGVWKRSFGGKRSCKLTAPYEGLAASCGSVWFHRRLCGIICAKRIRNRSQNLPCDSVI